MNKVFNVYYYDNKGNLLDMTQIDEKDEELAKELFVEFGHNINDLAQIGFKGVWENE